MRSNLCCHPEAEGRRPQMDRGLRAKWGPSAFGLRMTARGGRFTASRRRCASHPARVLFTEPMVRRAALGPLVALAASGCHGCRGDHPYVPYVIETADVAAD